MSALSVLRPRLGSAPWVLGLLALWLLATAGLRPLLLPDEGRYGEVAREMLAGDGLVPLLGGLPFFHKPPLTYWVDMLAMRVFGVSAFAARMGPALGAWLMGAALWLTLRRWHGERVAAAGLGALATCVFFYVGGQYANHDMLVAGTLSVAVLAFARALEQPGTVDARWRLAGWAACGLAVLAKGLIGIVLPALIIGPWLLARGRWRQLLALLHPAGLAVFAVIALPWFVAMQQRFPGFFDYFVMEQHFRRYASAGTFNNRQPVWFYFAVLPLLTLPWSAFAPAALRRFWQQRAWADSDGRGALLAWWLLAILLFFSLPKSKLVGYILPTLAPWCMLIAPVLVASRWRRTATALGVVLCLGSVVLLAWQAPKSNRDVGRALARQMGAGDQVVMVDGGFHDVAFEARLAKPALLASRWDDPAIRLRDDWRRELSDATRFDPAAAEALLVPLDSLPRLVCQGQVIWLVEGNHANPRAAQVPGAVKVMQGRHAQLWRAPPRQCEPVAA
ncbi:glycosyltransferase family 39 protein [Ideonella sp. DXS22W]|uniref:Glycosyltransferase family 39 protein n=1 Tax=Pseudaquabacterium inlustre TaxID=2984192 RepID=A0ABU9CB54_9BURK